MRALSVYLHSATLANAAVDFFACLAIAMAAALLQADGHISGLTAMAHGLSLATCVLFFNTASGLYQPQVRRRLPGVLARSAFAAMFALPAAYVLFQLLPSVGLARDAVSFASLAGVGMVMAYRLYASQSGAGMDLRSRVAVLGTGRAARSVANALRDGDPHANVVGFFPAPNEAETSVPPGETLPRAGSLVEAAKRLRVDEIIVALGERRGGNTPLRELLDCKVQGVRVSYASTHFERRVGRILLDHVNASWLVFGDGFEQGAIRTAVKRAFDVVCSVLLLAVSLPAIVLTALAVAAETRGPVLYRQQRVGRNGHVFDVLKFRSMRADAEQDGRPRWAATADDRVTRVGKIIRLLRIDELPQLWNVLKGEMSLVGPRPERPFFVDQLTKDIPYYALRHSVKPGLTGWAQVRFHYGATVEDSHEKLQYDLFYVKNHSLLLDVMILLETVAVVLTGKGAR